MELVRVKKPSRNFEEIIKTTLHKLYKEIPELYAYTSVFLNEYENGYRYPERLIEIELDALPDYEVREVAFGRYGGDWNVLYIIKPISLKEFMLFFRELYKYRKSNLK